MDVEVVAEDVEEVVAEEDAVVEGKTYIMNCYRLKKQNVFE